MRFSSALRWSSAAAFVGVGLIALSGCRSRTDALEIAARQLQYRRVEGRIHRSPYAAWRKPREGQGQDAAAESNLREVALRLLASNASEELRARAFLLTGNASVAKEFFERITSRGNASAAVWSDYSAALCADAAPDDMFQLASALAAADHALEIDPQLPEALFNRALAFERLSLRDAAAEAYDRYLLVDASSPWGSEVRLRLETLQSSLKNDEKARNAFERVASSDDELFINDTAIAFPQQARSWAETTALGAWGERVLEKDSVGAAARLRRCRIIGRALEKQGGDSLIADAVRAIDASANPSQLAKAHVAYVRGRHAYLQPGVAASVTALEEARRLFDANGSPMGISVRLWLAEITRWSGDANRLESMLRDISRRTPERYRALRAKIEFSLGSSAAIKGRHDDAIKLYRSASAGFTVLGESTSAARTREVETALLSRVGESAEAWRLRHLSLLSAAETGDNLSLTFTLSGAVRDAAVAGRWDVAHALLNAIIETPQPSEARRNDALAWRVIAASRAGLTRTAAVELSAARTVEPPPTDLALVEALSAKKTAEALTLLAKPLKLAEQMGNSITTSQLLVERARLFRATDQRLGAQDDLERAVALLERNPAPISTGTIRDAIIGTPYRAYPLLADSLDARGEIQRALDTLELYSARINLHPRDGSPSPTDIHLTGHLPGHTLIVTYGVFDDRLVIYESSSLGKTRTTVAVKRSEIERLVSAFDQAIASDDRARIQNIGRSLASILVTPIAKQVERGATLVFVRDPAFATLSFGALVNDNQHYLIEDYEVVVTPSVFSYLRASHTRTTISRALLSVGNPLSRDSFNSLPAAESEAEQIAAMYPSHALLVRADATKERVVGNLPYCDAAHFAVHANAGLGEAMPPHLILTSTADDDGKLTTAEIAALRLTRVRTVVLAGCRTADSSPGQSGSDSLVNAFLAAGAGSVVGTLWEIEDAPAREMSTIFHRELRKGSTPAKALQTTQAEMIRRAVSPRDWAAFQLYGSGQ